MQDHPKIKTMQDFGEPPRAKCAPCPLCGEMCIHHDMLFDDCTKRWLCADCVDVAYIKKSLQRMGDTSDFHKSIVDWAMLHRQDTVAQIYIDMFCEQAAGANSL